MVTATFAKPLRNYMTEGGGITKLIQWRYEDNQMMKEINEEEKFQKMLDDIKNNNIDEEDGKIKVEILKNLIIELEKRGTTKDHLVKQYRIYPLWFLYFHPYCRSSY